MGSIVINVLLIGIMIGAMFTSWLYEPTEPDTLWICECVETVELTCVKQVCTRDTGE